MKRIQLRIRTLAVLCGSLHLGTAAHGQAPPPELPGETLLDRIADARARSMETDLETAERSALIDHVIELRQQLIEDGAASNDPELACWHADQAEDLLLRRIEFPNSWSTHLFNADPACPLLPSEIPLIIARGIDEVDRARTYVEASITAVEAEIEAGRENTALIERLRFERDLRIPLLEAIGLILASGIEAGASGQALAILDGLDPRSIELNQAEAIVARWRIQAALAEGDRGRLLESLEAAGGRSRMPSMFDRVRATAVIDGPGPAADLARRAFDESDPDRIYDRLLLADLHASQREELAVAPTEGMERNWEDGAVDLWIELLEIDHDTRDVIDSAIAARLVAIADDRDPTTMPLAVAWALARSELARRSRGESIDTGRTGLLEGHLRAHDGGGLIEARALDTLFRLTILEGERLEAARIGRMILVDHPDFTGPAPAMIANLVEPWALNGDPEASEIYEYALSRQVDEEDDASDTAGAIASQLARIRLARHLAGTGRVLPARSLLEGLEPADESIAVELIELRANTLAEAAESGAIDRPEVLELQSRLTDDGRRFLRMFSENGTVAVTPRLLREIYRARLTAVESNLRFEPRTEDLQVVNSIIDRTDLESNLRIEALFLRHTFRFLDPETRAEVIADASDIARAVGLDPELSMRCMVHELQSSLLLIDEAANAGRIQEAEMMGRERLRAPTKLISTEHVVSMPLRERMLVARAMSLGGWPERSIALWDSILEEQPDAWRVLEGRADALARSDSEQDLGEAIQLYRRLGQGDPGQFTPGETWWNAQLGQLLVLERAARSLEKIAPRIERLRLRDPALGGPRFKSAFESLQERIRSRPRP